MHLSKKILTMCALFSLHLTILSSGGPAPAQDGAQLSAGNTDSVVNRGTVVQNALAEDQPLHVEKDKETVIKKFEVAAVTQNVTGIINIIKENPWIIKAVMGKHPHYNVKRPYYFVEFIRISIVFDHVTQYRRAIFNASMEIGKNDSEFKEQVINYFKDMRALEDAEHYFRYMKHYWPELFEAGRIFHGKLNDLAAEIAQAANMDNTDDHVRTVSRASTAASAVASQQNINAESELTAQESAQAAQGPNRGSSAHALAETLSKEAEMLEKININKRCQKLAQAILDRNFDKAKKIIELYHNELLLMRVGFETTQPFIQYIYELLFDYTNIGRQEELFAFILSYAKVNEEFKKQITDYFYGRDYSSFKIRSYLILKNSLPDLFIEGTPLYTKLHPVEPRLFNAVHSSNSSAQSPALANYNARVAQHQSTAAAASSSSALASNAPFAALSTASATATSNTMPSTFTTAASSYSGVVWPANRTTNATAPNISVPSTPQGPLPILSTALIPANALPASYSISAPATAAHQVPNQNQNTAQLSRKSWASFFKSKRGLITLGVGAGIIFFGWKLLSKKSDSTENRAAAKTK